MIRSVVDNMKKDTGKTFEQWVKLAKKEGPDKHMKLLNWLKAKYGLKRYQAHFVATEVLNPGKLFEYERPDELLDQLYSGKKEHLRDAYEAVKKEAMKMKGVEEVVCKTYTSYRNRAQFAIAAPKTQKFLDLELAMPPGTKATRRLEAYAGNNEKFTHRIRLESAKDVDRDVKSALKQAAAHVGQKK
jgi:predicted transport protein